MQGITKYSGGGRSVQKNCIRELRAVYDQRKRTPAEHELDGFGEWEFIGQLGTIMSGEAKDVHTAWVDKWDFDSSENENIQAAEFVERRRQEYREWRSNRTAWKKLRAHSGFTSEPIKPTCDEPRDIDRLIKDIQIRFKSSTTENLDNLTKFTIAPDENAERMFARFNIIAKPLEDERPRVITVDQSKTSYLHHVKQLL